MSFLNRAILRSSKSFLKNAPRTASFVRPAAASFSTLLDKKELAEETKYIRNLEARKQEEIRKNLEKILALEDSHHEKQQLIGFLGK